MRNEFAFGNLAILIPLAYGGMVDPMVLRRRFSTALPLSNELMIRFKQNEPGQLPGSRRRFQSFIFGNLAILIPLAYGGMVDPMALRPHLSASLLVSDIV